MEHTPGPWTHQPNIGILASGREIARTIVADAYEKADYEEAWANARLIAAAPELLAALKAVYDCVVFPACEGCNSQFAVDGATAAQIRAALALATESPQKGDPPPRAK